MQRVVIRNLTFEMDLQNQNKNYYALVTANQKGTRDKESKKKNKEIDTRTIMYQS